MVCIFFLSLRGYKDLIPAEETYQVNFLSFRRLKNGTIILGEVYLSVCLSFFLSLFLSFGCLKSMKQAKNVSGQVSSNNFPCCHMKTEIVDHSCYLTWSMTHEHPRYNKADPYYLLTRQEQGQCSGSGQATTVSTIITRILNSALAIQSGALEVLAVRQQNIYCSSASSTSHPERETGQTTLQ